MLSGSRTHNKSGLAGLSLLEHTDEEIHEWRQTLRSRATSAPGLCSDSPCLCPTAADGRHSHHRVKVAYGYQIVAFAEFGREALSEVEASKGQDSKLISHTCGTRNCCTGGHMVIESKAINDDRTHCHFCMRNILRTSGREGVKVFLELGGCPHAPRCGSTRV
jgi:hypothetical protein